MEIRRNLKIIVNYDRGWDIMPTDEVKEVYEAILEIFN
jgi:hypothetical protein